MRLQSGVATTTVHELLFADDCVLNATSEEDMERSMDHFAAACDNFGMVINTQKTAAMHQPLPDAVYIDMSDAQLQVVDNFMYLSSTLSRTTKIDKEVARRISKAGQAFGSLQSTVGNRHGLLLNTDDE
ncbi:hypothetical protein SprV_0301079200 [Sparganum proliferum]